MWIKFGEIKGQLMILLIYPIGIICARYNTIFLQNNPYFYLFLFFISHFLALIPLVIYKLIEKILDLCHNGNDTINFEEDKNKKIITLNLSFKNEIEELTTEINSTKRREKFLKLSFISILYFLTYTFFYYTNFITTTSFYGNISMVTEVLYFSLLDKMILGKKIYSHHFFSMILITISIIGLYILLIIKFIEFNDWDAWRDFIFPTILNFIVYFFFCFYLIKSKSYIDKYFISPYEIIIFLGIFCLILLLIFEPITFFIPCDNPVMCYEGHFAGIISGFKLIKCGKDILICCFWIIFLFMTCYGLWLTVAYLSPTHFLTSDSIITFELNILLDCYNPYFILMNNPLFYIFSIITIFGCLIYNEIIIIQICGLNFNTRNEIINRQITDFYNYGNDDLSSNSNDINSELSDVTTSISKNSDISNNLILNPNE